MMRSPAGFYLFAFQTIASFLSFAGIVVAGMALISLDADWDRFARGAVMFVAAGLVSRFASKALEEVEEE